MSINSKNLVICGVCLSAVAVTSVVFITSASVETDSSAQVSQGAVGNRSRNLSLQPEALRVNRRLGKRLSAFGKAISTTSAMSANLTTAGTDQVVTLTRRQVAKGENVELSLAGRLLTWNAEEGTKSTLGTPSGPESLLLERLIYDSPDYFVLAQLRGASYFTVARNVRPPDAPDNYDGPLWTVVRVDERPMKETTRPRSSWRLYYINSQTGLIDRIVSQLDGESIEAVINAWSENSGETTPSHITWSIGGRVVMRYQLTSVSHSK